MDTKNLPATGLGDDAATGLGDDAATGLALEQKLIGSDVGPTRYGLTEQTLTDLFLRWTVPEQLRKNAAALNAEFGDIVNQVFQLAPETGLEEWLGKLSEQLVTTRRSRLWPTVAETMSAAAEINAQIDAAASRAELARLGTGGSALGKSDVEIWAGRVKAGKAIGINLCYGQTADAMVRHFGVTDAQLEKYRRTYTREMAKMYGTEYAEKLYAEGIAITETATETAATSADRIMAARDVLPPGDRE